MFTSYCLWLIVFAYFRTVHVIFYRFCLSTSSVPFRLTEQPSGPIRRAALSGISSAQNGLGNQRNVNKLFEIYMHLCTHLYRTQSLMRNEKKLINEEGMKQKHQISTTLATTGFMNSTHPFGFSCCGPVVNRH